MLIQNNKASMVRIGGVGRFEGENAQGIEGGVVLRPGVNDLNEEQTKAWLQNAQLPAVKGLVDEGHLELVDEKIEDFHKLAIGKARRVVAKTFDLELLGTWRKGEKRQEVKGAIKDQVAKLEAKIKAATKAKPADEGGDDEDEEPEA